MSGKQGELVDRRKRKTRAALLSAFADLIQSQRYDQIRVDDILKQADVGRSTFYEHYRSKDDLLVQALAPLQDLLAQATVDGLQDGLEQLLQHFAEVAVTARALLVRRQVDRSPDLSGGLAKRIQEHHPELDACLSSSDAALQIAEAQWSLIAAWLENRIRCSPAQLAEVLCKTSQALVAVHTPQH